MKPALIGAAAVIEAGFASPALAQAVISDPGYCAQFYPNANCQNLAPAKSHIDGGWRNNWQSSNATLEHHWRRPRSAAPQPVSGIWCRDSEVCQVLSREVLSREVLSREVFSREVFSREVLGRELAEAGGLMA